MPNPVTIQSLDALLGKGIGELCGNHFDSPSQNHCAHFVSHTLGIRLGMLCGDMTSKTKGTGASIRCDELFNRLDRRGKWEDAPVPQDGLLVFVTSAANVVNNYMANVPRKHVGIVCGGQVYNFGNTEHAVRKEPSVEAFRTRLGHVYRDAGIPLFFGVPQ